MTTDKLSLQVVHCLRVVYLCALSYGVLNDDSTFVAFENRMDGVINMAVFKMFQPIV